jgi:hypothetical protein
VPELVYLKYEDLDDMLKVIIYSSQSMLGVIPTIGNATIHYTVQKDKPAKKFIQLKRLTGDYSFVDGIGIDAQSLYVPVLRLEKSTLEFPL